MARPKKDYALVPYMVYLHPVMDRDLIERLEPYRQTSRASGVIRDALRSFFGAIGGSIRQSTVVNEARVVEPPVQPVSMTSSVDAKQRVKNAFM